MISPHLPSAALAAVTLAASAAFAQPAPEAPTVSAAPVPGSPAAPGAPAPASAASGADPRGAPAQAGAQMSAGVPSAAATVTHPPVAPGAADDRPPGALGLYDDESEREPRPGDEGAGSGSGMLGVVRIDGKGRGFAAGAGLLIARGRLDLEILALRSDVFGGYVGARFRPYGGMFRPYIAAGLPGFVFDHDEQAGGTTQSTKRLAVGLRGAIGFELRIDHHVSAFGDLGFEHFFLSDERFEADLFVPTLGVIGRL